MIIDVLKDTIIDCARTLPFLLGAFLILEWLEHYSGAYVRRTMEKVGKAGPLAGALLGCVPQCGFSVLASNLFAGGVISIGTLLSVFLATSDEAILILLGHPDKVDVIFQLLGVKVMIAVAAGFLIDGILVRKKEEHKLETMCQNCGCHDHHGILLPALHHTGTVLLYLFLFNGVLNLAIELVGLEQLSRYLLSDSLFQPVMAALIGMIPNCASSVLLTELFLSGVIGFPSVVAGLCAGSGVGIAVLFKMNKNQKENLQILGILYLIAVTAGIVLQICM